MKAGTQRKGQLQETLEGRGNEGGVGEDASGILRLGEQKSHSQKEEWKTGDSKGGEKGSAQI